MTHNSKTKETIYLGEGTSTRRKLFKNLIEESPLDKYDITDKLEEADYVFFFDTDIHTSLDIHTGLVAELVEEGLNVIVDITKDLYTDNVAGSFLTLLTVCAKFITCSDALIQEKIYFNTGRLAGIVNTPTSETSFTPPVVYDVPTKEDLDILWVGTSQAQFSIKRAEQEHPDVTFNTFTLSAPKRAYEKAFTKSDLVYLPKTFTEEDEEVRVLMVIEAIGRGKFVIAPDMSSYEFLSCAESLDEGIAVYLKDLNKVERIITERQEILREQSSPTRSLEQLENCLNQSLEDTFLEDFDDLDETESLFI